ncbi:EAL domain-containing protein [Legionella parisiensis]|uniref:Cyclic di-GMP phosphodiesterase Gmr n=1 Tax=Legionella parisiensis TaxID=45071 RepID=A0A1E5JUN1_9GAMM|nr:EAL domain-containing protein [Legionella parisiensis]KTD43156.1 GGDEF domain-containing sensory box protein [Legionella parisiensis]OEH48246.1 Cyclic di-GMP phosphodiesterase Gmr [Legionella parisiensis]STX77764.1 sensory box protein, GGDEF family protein, LssE [Legionella parisiensis]
MISISGYALREKMRRNHNIDTYYALRLKDRCRVLLKTPNKLHPSSENLAILQHEFHLLKMIETPKIIKAYDFLQNTYTPVLILEDVKGQLLTSYLLMHQLGIDGFFNLALQLVDIVGELHQRQIIHKEINPSNIVIDPENMVLKLVDLSVSTKLAEETFDYLKLSEFEEGLAYISPEQTGRINRPVDYRTDFYSLGITFFEMLANQLPFQAVDALELVHCHIAKKPPTVLHARPDTPKMLAEIIDKLLGKMPEERYSSIIGLKSDLQECFRQWQLKGSISEFSLGAHDIRDHLIISHNLYGREKQVNQLTKAFNRVCQGTKEMIFVAGYSGIGKTSLVKEVHKPIIQYKGYYIQGKFDQLQRSIPYSAIVTAFKNLVKQVLSESEERLEKIKKLLIYSLGNVGQVVIDVIPDIELIIGKQASVCPLNPAKARIRFDLVFQNFVRVFAQLEHPLVLFLDDLQWADNSSLHFIENLLQDRETNYLLIIGAYRNNEINENHPLQLSINNLKENKVNLSTLTLKPLRLNNIQELIHDTLSGSQRKIQGLVQCIYDKTQGNPFFINAFLRNIYEQKILNFSYKRGAWEWDLAKAQQQSATDNVIDLLTARIHLLPNTTQEILKLGSCFGHQFDFNTLKVISRESTSQIAEQLCQAIKANLIYPLEESYKTLGLMGLDEHVATLDTNSLHYNFSHDRIQQAAYELINIQARPGIHLKIGRLLLKNKPLIENDERLFDVLEHFNQSIALIRSSKERLKLAQYNLWAGQKAKLASAYYAANEYLSVGIELLKPNHWEKNYNLTFQLHKELAVCRYLISDFETADKYFSELLKHAKNPLDEIEIYRLKIEILSTLGKHSEALEMGLNTLRNFGIKLPRKPKLVHVLIAIYKVKFQLKNTEVESINLPLMNDAKQIALVDLITQLFNSAFITNQQLFVILTCKNISLSLKYGYTESTSMSIPVYAFIIMHSLNLYHEALSFVTLYNNLKQKYGASSFEGKNQFVLGSFIEPYQTSIHLCNATVTKAFRMCSEIGDLVYSNYSNLLLVLHSLSAGKKLDEVKKNVQTTLSFMSRVKISDFIEVAKFWDYLCQCLEKPGSTKMKQISLFEENIIKGRNKTELSFFYSSLTLLHFLLGNFSEAIKAGKNHELHSEYDKGLISHLDGKFFFALALFCQLPYLSKSMYRLSLKKLKQLDLFIKKYASWCPENFKVYTMLLAAEFSRLNGQHEKALALYEQTIETALAGGIILIAAIANERAAYYCLNLNLNQIAKIYLHNAHCYFKDWGANTKVRLLEPMNHNAADASLASLMLPPTQAKAKNQTIDMLTILKFTQLISSEIRLDKLLQNLLVIVLEHAGAQRSIILTKNSENWVVEAEGDLEQQSIHLIGSENIEREIKYPLSILNYVQRTQKPIILNNARQSELTFQDVYVQGENPRSLLMMPLFYKGNLCRMLYLENNSTSHTFTANHLDSLQLLASQAMISLENAKLYYQATHDPLTGLANRNMLYEFFQQMTKQIKHFHEKVALLFLDIDYFKVINDTLGHDNGDKLLIHIAKTINSCLRECDFAARLGGDEFTIILSNINSKEQITMIVKKLLSEISKPVPIDAHLIQIASSMGISIFPNDGQDIETLLKLADTALYQAKEKGRNQFHYYSTELYEEYQQTHGLGKELQQAYDKEEFFLMYQPFYTTDGHIIGLESLLRWNHPEKGIIEASKFIRSLEKSSLMIPVSEWIIKKTCHQAKIWQDQKILPGPIAINISAIQFIRHSLSKIVGEALAENRLNGSCIELEITESVFIEYNDALYKEIETLKGMGVHLVIDDFGTGYSSLSYLKNLPIQKIKIDKAFINNCHKDYLDQTIIKAIATIAHKLNINVVAEGVENKSQLQFLRKHSIDCIQGYYYSHPLTVQACETLLKNMPLKKHR